jgi:hypothetical protein
MAMEITLSQATRSDCKLKLAIGSYSGMAEMSKALAAGMTPIVSYWKSADMLWFDGKGVDGQGPCETDNPDQCSKRTKFSNFSIEAIPGSKCSAKLTNQQPTEPVTTTTFMAVETTTTLVVAEGVGGFNIQAGSFGFLAGGLSVLLAFAVSGQLRDSIRSRQAQKTSQKQERTLQRVTSSQNSLASLVE